MVERRLGTSRAFSPIVSAFSVLDGASLPDSVQSLNYARGNGRADGRCLYATFLDRNIKMLH